MSTYLLRANKWLVVTLCAVCIAELGAYVVIHQSSGVYREAIPAVSGYSIEGRPVSYSESACTVLRITAENCPYSKQDRPGFERIASAARSIGCRVVEVGPRVGDVAPRDTAEQLQYVAMELGDTLNPFLTPQTIVLDAAGQPQWQRQGAMDEGAIQNALQALHRFR